MCFNVVSPVKRAEEDILAYKFLVSDNGKLTSPINTSRAWVAKKVKTARLDKSKLRFGRIFVGLHCYKNLEKAEMSIGWIDGKIYKAIIPKGSWYYENDDQFVSNKMMIPNKTPIRKNG